MALQPVPVAVAPSVSAMSTPSSFSFSSLGSLTPEIEKVKAANRSPASMVVRLACANTSTASKPSIKVGFTAATVPCGASLTDVTLT